MLRKSLVPSVLLLTITALSTMTSVAQAGEVKVPFEGKIARACEFMDKTLQAGTLIGNDPISPKKLSSKGAGTPGRVTIKCNTDAVVSATGYEPTSKDTFEVSTAAFTLSAGDQKEVTEVKVGIGNTPISVNLTLDSKDVIPAGTYAYNVLVSAVIGN
jgi:hypothetical protein